jgi:very-short-patch-repair endonuclease
MKWMKVHNSPGLTDKRRYLRAHETPQEKLLWERLRNKKLYGYKFKRQHSVGGYILDFYCCAEKVAIELDGFQHLKLENTRYDHARTEFLQEHNIRVLRFLNQEITTDIQSALDRILTLLQD